MAKPKGSKTSSDREKWNKVFNALVHMLQTQQTQLESLAKERKLLEDRIQLQYDRWVSDVNLFQGQISQMKKDFTAQEMERMVELAKSDLVVGLKQRDALMFKAKFEDADSELQDFREWFDYLSHKCSESNDIPRTDTNGKAETRNKSWEDKLRSLKSENERLTSEKNSEISALLAEKNFIWNQFNKLEHDTTEQLRKKQTEIEHANEKVQAFLRNIEELQASNSNKDNTIAALRTQMTKMESDSIRKSEEISKLSTELELLKKSKSSSVTPVLRRCTAGSGHSRRRGRSRGMDGGNITVKKELHSSQSPEKAQRSSKRKSGDVITISDTPKLFTSKFKVPKLKNSSPCVT